MYTPNKILSIVLSFCLLFTQSLYALPQNPEVVEGQASFDYSTPNKLEVTATTPKTIINYSSFNISSNEWVNFILPSSAATLLNRVIGNVSSEILGKLTSNQGTVMLINTKGINIAKDALIQAGGNLILSTLDIPDQDFINNHYIFERTTDPASIKNLGNLFAQDYLAILTSTFENTGTIQAKTINIAGADKVSLQLDPYIQVIVDKPLTSNPEQLDDQIKNTGTISSTDGRVYIEAQSLPNLFKTAINTTGIIRATAVVKENNEIVLVANEPIFAAGTFKVNDGALKLKTKSILYMSGIYDIKGSTLFTDPDDDINIPASVTYFADPNLNDPGNITITNLGTVVTGDGCSLTFTAGGDFTMDAGTTIETINGTGDITITADNIILDTIDSVGNIFVYARDNLNLNANIASTNVASYFYLYADNDEDGVGIITRAPGTNITSTFAVWFKTAQDILSSTYLDDATIISRSKLLETTFDHSITIDTPVSSDAERYFFAAGDLNINANIGIPLRPNLRLYSDYDNNGIGNFNRTPGTLINAGSLELQTNANVVTSVFLTDTTYDNLTIYTTANRSITVDADIGALGARKGSVFLYAAGDLTLNANIYGTIGILLFADNDGLGNGTLSKAPAVIFDLPLGGLATGFYLRSASNILTSDFVNQYYDILEIRSTGIGSLTIDNLLTTGQILLNSANNININNNLNLTSAVFTNDSFLFGGAFNQALGTTIITNNHTLNLSDNTPTTPGDISLGNINVGALGTLQITATGATNILSNTSLLTAGNIFIQTPNSVGQVGNRINTVSGNIQLQATNVGDIYLNNTGDLNLRVWSFTGITDIVNTGNISLIAPLGLWPASISAGGDVRLQAIRFYHNHTCIF
ncbi:MAG: filamentous hemagglutinin N-terminal domain-containing protein [Candidatus Omnitrophota bacterium]